MGDAYSRRSLYFERTGQYKNSIDDIKLAYVNRVSFQHHTLLQRRFPILKQLKSKEKKDDDDYVFKLSYDAHANIPGIADCLALKVNDAFGHHIVTNRKLLAGDIIAIEEFFFNVVHVLTPDEPDKYFFSCAYCLKSGYHLHLIPCGGCQHTMYCSSECQDKANAEYHYIECGLFETVVSTACVIPIRFFFRALAACNGNIDELQKLTQEADTHSRCTIFDGVNQIVAAAYVSNRSIPCDDEIDKFAVMESWLRKYDKTAEMMRTHGTFIMEFITRMLHVVSSHMMSVNMYNVYMGTGAHPSDCVAYAPFISLINHSCADNAFCIRQNKRVILIANQTIEAGEQIFINYG